MRLSFCAVCGSIESLEHHHFVPLELGGPDVEANLLTLCSAHHGDMHGMRRAGNHKELTKSGSARVAWLGLGSPNPRAGGEANRVKWREKRAQAKAMLIAHGANDRTFQATADLLNAQRVASVSGKPWTWEMIRRALR